MTTLAFLDIGFGEMVVVAFVALLLFGGRLPEVMRTLGVTYRKFRTGMDDLTRQTTKAFDMRPSLPPYKPTPPAATPAIPIGSAQIGPARSTPIPGAGPVAPSTTVAPWAAVAPKSPPASGGSSDDPPPV